ncbi:hypothetical protein GJ496_006582 [Pomphorhynchus laevis]|nr:hypothetical protein GJ496_006582 [Pomphorhynchus laevis]
MLCLFYFLALKLLFTCSIVYFAILDQKKDSLSTDPSNFKNLLTLDSTTKKPVITNKMNAPRLHSEHIIDKNENQKIPDIHDQVATNIFKNDGSFMEQFLKMQASTSSGDEDDESKIEPLMSINISLSETEKDQLLGIKRVPQDRQVWVLFDNDTYSSASNQMSFSSSASAVQPPQDRGVFRSPSPRALFLRSFNPLSQERCRPFLFPNRPRFPHFSDFEKFTNNIHLNAAIFREAFTRPPNFSVFPNFVPPPPTGRFFSSANSHYRMRIPPSFINPRHHNQAFSAGNLNYSTSSSPVVDASNNIEFTVADDNQSKDDIYDPLSFDDNVSSPGMVHDDIMSTVSTTERHMSENTLSVDNYEVGKVDKDFNSKTSTGDYDKNNDDKQLMESSSNPKSICKYQSFVPASESKYEDVIAYNPYEESAPKRIKILDNSNLDCANDSHSCNFESSAQNESVDESDESDKTFSQQIKEATERARMIAEHINASIAISGDSNFDEIVDTNREKQLQEQKELQTIYETMMHKRRDLEVYAANLRRDAKLNGHNEDEVEDPCTTTSWEHKVREAEMEITREWADRLTEMAEGKHHIGDFLPPDELNKFNSTYDALKSGSTPDLSDYKDFKIQMENIGYQLLQKMGWQEGKGLGREEQGRLNPINKGKQFDTAGIGAQQLNELSRNDDEYDMYRKRMMLAYKFRPNPLNNPRRPYY